MLGISHHEKRKEGGTSNRLSRSVPGISAELPCHQGTDPKIHRTCSLKPIQCLPVPSVSTGHRRTSGLHSQVLPPLAPTPPALVGPWSLVPGWFPVIVDCGTAHCNFAALWLANGGAASAS